MKKKLSLSLFALLLTVLAIAQGRHVTGRVINGTSGEPLGAVSILVKATGKGAYTDGNGNFTLDLDPGKKPVLIFSYSGFEDQTVIIDSDEPLNIKMKSTDKNLDEIVVIGYGTVKKRDLTGSVVSVKGDEVRKIATSNIIESVQGKIAGVDIVRTKGLAGSGVSVAIRGNRSITAGNGPLYIIDGIQFDNYPFQDINSNDVESLEVLKDASSTAIYGSRGANGVIIITTKKGTNGKVKISANSYYGISEVAGYPKPMTGPQFADLKRQAARTAGKWNSTADDPAVFTSAAELAAVKAGASTYYPGLLISKGSQQDYGVGVAGGNEKTRVYFSFDYFKEKGVLKNDFSGRYTVRLNIDQTIASTFKVGLESQLTYYDVNSRAEGVLTIANKILPYYTPYNTDGTLAKYPGNGAQFNPLFDDLPGAYVNKTNTTRVLSTAYAEWKPITGLTLRSNLGVSNSSTRTGFFESASSIDRALSSGSLSSVTNSGSTDLTWDNVVNWQKKFGEHSVEVTALTSYLSRRSDNAVASATGQLLAGQSFYALQNNPANVQVSSGYAGSNLLSGAFRVNYGYKGKYLLTVTGREDGASVLSTGNQWSFFPSAAAAWRIIDENFMRKQHLFSDLKLRASYGITGNAAVGAYQTQSGLLLIPFEWNDQSALAYGLDPQTGNPNLKWELTGSADAGVDFSLFKGRVNASVDYYDSRTHDLLLTRQLPATSGESKILENIGKTRNNGIEVSLRTINIQSKVLTWSTSLTYTHNKERIVELVGKQSDIGNKWIIGYPVNSFYDYKKIGIWQTVDSVAAKSYGYKPGDIRVRDLSGPTGKPDGKIDANNDRMVVGSAVPRYSIGFSNDLRIMNFDLNVYVFARVGQTFTSAYANKFEPNAIENGAVVNYWTPENPTNDYPRPNINVSRAALPFATTLGYKDGSFVKIRNISLGYTLPAALVKRWHMNGLRVYASMKNYFTFSKVKDYDPEGGGSFEAPLTKLVVTGINIDL